MNFLKRLTYRPDVLAVARALHLTQFLRNCYYWSTGRNGRTAKFRVNGVEAVFCARTPLELRHIEYNLVLEEDSFLSLLTTTLRPGDVFFDVGSNLGLFAVFVAKIVGPSGRVAAFEPQKDFCKKLRENVEANELSNVTVFQKALGESNVSGKLFVEGVACPSLVRGAIAANGSLEGSNDEGSTSSFDLSAEIVEIVTGDWLREDQKLPVPRAVKIDVEGFEYSVLQGLKETLSDPACQILCCEIHSSFLPSDVTVEKILDLVRSVGFKSIQTHERLTQLHLIASKA